jgi:hypothetical protein
VRCPDCQTEIPDRSAVCPNCHAVLEEAPVVETGLEDLWEQSEAGVMTSAKPTREVDAASAREAVARARRSQPSARTPRVPSTPAAARTPSTPAAPPVPPPRRGHRPSSGSTGPQPRIAPPPTGPLPSLSALPEIGRPGSIPSLSPTGPVAAPAPDPAPAPGGRSFGPASQAQISTHIVSADPEAQRGTQVVDLSLPAVVRQLAASKKAKDREEARSERAKGAPGKPGIGVEESRVTQGIDEVMASLSLLYARMHRIDRWTLVALAVAFVGAFLPWRNVRGEGLLAGIQDYGAISVGVSLLTFLCIYARTVRRRLAGLVIVLQLLIAAGLTAVPVLRFMLAGGESDLSVGLYISGAGGVAVEVLTLMRLARLSS